MHKLLRLVFFGLLFLVIIFSVKAVENFGSYGAKMDKDLTLEDMLIYAIQDEYLARAEYYAIIKKFGNIKPFSNIVKAEESHISELVPLFQKYGFKIPVDTAKNYITIPESIKNALSICVQAEIDNIAMYELFLKKQLPDDVATVFKNLLKGSKNHLNAFQNSLKRY